MSARRKKPAAADRDASAPRRCAIYTRKSSEEGLDQEFNSLDAQREAAEAFIASQKAEGWVVLPDHYDDGGFSGGSMERPALDRMLRDIEAGKIDCVVVYKVDRLSRSLMDFSRILESFEGNGVSFVSVTQQFNTTHSMGRLTLNILLSFAQFEREIIGERIRDKILAQKKKGKWSGGVPILGYDVDRTGPSPKLVVNHAEAVRVRRTFEMYIEKGSLLPVVEELRRKDWPNKRRLTKKGKSVGGRPFDKNTLYALLRNQLVIGKITHKTDVYEGEHDAIIDVDLFERVQTQLSSNGRCGGTEARNKYNALLRGLLRCKTCDHAMTHTFTSAGRKKKSVYRYYRCVRAIKGGIGVCPTGTLPAAEIDRVVIDEIRGLSQDQALFERVFTDATSAVEAEATRLRTERTKLRAEVARKHGEIRDLATSSIDPAAASARLAALHDQIASADRRITKIDSELDELERDTVTRAEAMAVFSDFDKVWSHLTPREQARLLTLLLEKIDYDGGAGTIAVTFRSTGLNALVQSTMEQSA